MTDFICFKCKSKIKTKRWGKSKIEVKCACPHEFDYIRTDNDDDAIEKFLTQFQLVNPEIDNIGESWTDSAAKYLEELWSTNPERLAKTELKNYLSKRFGRSVGAITSQLKHMKDSDTQKHESTEKSKIISEHQLPYELPKLPADNLDDDGNKNNDDWNDDYQDEYGFNSRNSQRLNQYAVISDRFCSTCKKNGIAHLVPDTNICDVCGASPPIILGPLACGRYWSPNQNNGSNYRNSLLSKYILDNKHENPAASNFLSNLMFDFINNHHKFFYKLDFDLIIPVPNFKSDLQHVAAVSVSLKLSKLLNISCNTDILIKTQSTAGRKHHKTAEQRRNMAYSSYDICTDTPIKNQTILLIDDVLVGGSTVRKCAELLLENGANTILIMCLGDYSSYD